MTLAVVILNWNGKLLLEQFLPSVVSHSEGATIYVADNASNDHSVAFVKDHFPSVKVIQNTENGGYAKGYNDALDQVTEDIFILLNSDVEVTPQWLSPLKKCFETEDRTAILQPKLLDHKNRDYFEYAGAAGGFIDRLGYPYCRGRLFQTLEKDTGQYDDDLEIFWASGACLAIRRAVFYELGKLDEDFFAHQEEIDLCWRANNAGFKVKYIASSKVYHLGGATLSNMNPKKTFYNFRNTLFALIKNVKSKNVVLLILGRLLLDGVAAMLFLWQLKPRHALAILQAHFDFYKNLKKLLLKRQNIQKSNTYSTIFSIVFEYFIKGKKTYKKL